MTEPHHPEDEDTDEQALLRDTVRRLVEERVAPAAAAVDRTRARAMATWPALVELGLPGIAVPEESGGAGMGTAGLGIALQELARGCASTALVLYAHAALAGQAIHLAGSDEQRQRLLPELAAGERLAGAGLFELDEVVGSAPSHVTAHADGAGWRLEGRLPATWNAAFAEVFMIAAREPAGARALFVVEGGTHGLDVAEPMETLGARGSGWSTLHLRDVRVPPEARLAHPRAGTDAVAHVLGRAQVHLAAISLGIAEAALARSLRYAHERTTFGKEIARHQAIAYKLADMKARVDATRTLVRRALREPADSGAGTVARLAAADAAVRVGYDAIQVHGGYGYSAEYEVERMWRDARFVAEVDGAPDDQRAAIAASLVEV